MMDQIYAIFGAGGFGREIMPYARETLARIDWIQIGAPLKELVFVEKAVNQPVINGHRCISEDEFLSCDAIDKYFNISIADYKIRESIADKLLAAGIKPFAVHSDHVIINDSTIAEGSVLCGFTIVASNGKIGRFFHANMHAYTSHDCVIGDFVTLAPHASINGWVVVEDYAYIGTGAVIRQGTENKPTVIGKGAIVGMGAMVTKDVPPFTTVVGNPAVKFKK